MIWVHDTFTLSDCLPIDNSSMSQTNSVKLSSFGLVNTNNMIVTELRPRKPELIKKPTIVWSYIGVKHAQLNCIQPTQPSWLGPWSKWCGMLKDQGPTQKKHVRFPWLSAQAQASYFCWSHRMFVASTSMRTPHFDHATWEIHFHHGSCHTANFPTGTTSTSSSTSSTSTSSSSTSSSSTSSSSTSSTTETQRVIGTATWDDENTCSFGNRLMACGWWIST